ncbi:hypothetical protein OKW50_002004 [Paraburkholderia youngii]
MRTHSLMRSCRRFCASGDIFAYRDAILIHFRLRSSLYESHCDANGARATCSAALRRDHASGLLLPGRLGKSTESAGAGAGAATLTPGDGWPAGDGLG